MAFSLRLWGRCGHLRSLPCLSASSRRYAFTSVFLASSPPAGLPSALSKSSRCSNAAALADSAKTLTDLVSLAPGCEALIAELLALICHQVSGGCTKLAPRPLKFHAVNSAGATDDTVTFTCVCRKRHPRPVSGVRYQVCADF